jgi:tRNA(Ile)-lysidine synthase
LRLPTFVAAVDRALQSLGGPADGEALVVGLSGGADSVALLDALVSLEERRGFRSIGAHLDHGLRPDSVEDAAFCRSLCERFGIPFRTAVADVRSRARRERGGLEQAARRERYGFLHEVRKETEAAAIAVAHTRDDQAETLLLRLLRGAGATGLGGMRARRGRIVRPLLGVSREQVLAHLGDRGLTWREDATNADLALQRNRVRHELMPYLEARFNPALRRGLARTAGLLADEAAYLRSEADRLLDRISRAEGEEIVLERAALAEAPPALGRVVVRQALRRAGGLARVGAIHVERVLALACSAAPSGRHLPLPGGREVRYRHDEVRLGPRLPVAAEGAMLGREP